MRANERSIETDRYWFRERMKKNEEEEEKKANEYPLQMNKTCF